MTSSGRHAAKLRLTSILFPIGVAVVRAGSPDPPVLCDRRSPSPRALACRLYRPRLAEKSRVQAAINARVATAAMAANEVLAGVADVASSDLLDFIEATGKDCSLSYLGESSGSAGCGAPGWLQHSPPGRGQHATKSYDLRFRQKLFCEVPHDEMRMTVDRGDR